MASWFRLYAELADDPKVQMLSADLFRAWVNCLCVACKNGGKITDIRALAFTLRMSPDQAESTLASLEKHGLWHRVSNQHGTSWAPHNWEKRQFKSDTSTERVKRFRSVTRNAPETETETDKDSSLRSESSSPVKSKDATSPKPTPRQALEAALSPEMAGNVIDHRQRIKSPLTTFAAQQLAKGFEATGDPNAAATMMIEKGWRGFSPEWFENERNGANGRNGNHHGNGRPQSTGGSGGLAALRSGLDGTLSPLADGGYGPRHNASRAHADARAPHGAGAATIEAGRTADGGWAA